ncbi:hypothetical protein J8F10_18345 [Gemmata sp. G18]|uniref:YncE family protein n=1 Tax=Gemmata palustris TaxID=2822762 RepID=A0ABS5BU38_9BACT|nr:hypothetical protein [Gemmata palustris]MBP3957226.1 hypothetical protein [Gemmata palustris]
MPLLRTLAVGVTFATLLTLSGTSAAADPITSFKLPFIKGGVMLADAKTLVVSIPSKATLVYYDTIAEKELKRVELDFKPTFMAVQGDKLFVATDGSAKIHVLDGATAKELKEIAVPGEPVQALGCHPTKGLLYAVNFQNQVYAIDSDKGSVDKTGATGQYIAVDPSDGKTVYFGIQKPIRNVLVMEEGPGKSVKISLATANIRAVILKYAVADKDLKLIGVNDNASVNGTSLAVSSDGKQVVLAGAGGWRSKVDPRSVPGVAVFDTKDMETRLGQTESPGGGPQGVAFHPNLNLGVTLCVDAKGKLLTFSTKSFVSKDTYDVRDGSHPCVLTFGAKGTKIIYGSMPGVGGPKESTIEFFPLKLSDAEKEILQKAYPK